jgi:sugar lactone lactonase YvrE
MAVGVPDVLADGFGLIEGPRWHQGQLWISDFSGRKVHRIDEDGAVADFASVAGRPSGLGFRPDGTVLVSVMQSREVIAISPESGEMTQVADLTDLVVGLCNDMLVDQNGRCYVGGMGFDLYRGDRPAPGNVVLVDENDKARVVATDMLVPNGTVIDSHNRLIIAETNRSQLTGFTIADDGSLAQRHVFADLADLAPDGICIDVNDGIWAGAVFAEQFVYIEPSGRVSQRISIPGRWAVACALGGADMRTLFLLTAETTMREMRHDQARGRVEAVRVDVPGIVQSPRA